jgi:two-component system sensor histidine kinase BaeS
MRSLTVKLTLAFLLVGTIGAILVAVLVGQRTRSEFDRFRVEHDQPILVDALSAYYTDHGSWSGVDQWLRTSPQHFAARGVVLADANGGVVIGNRSYAVGQILPASALDGCSPVQVGGRTVGFVLFPGPNERGDGSPGPPPPDVAFLERVTWATAISAAIAALIALILGVLLARTLTHPVRELTAATQAMARGALGQRVTARSRDEIGELARSFNQMSADLARASQLRKQMTADLAHDLRTPLSILRGYTEGLQDGRLQGSPSLYTIMHGEVEHLQRLVEDLRVLSLADAGELPLARRAVDPAALLERTGLAYIVQAEQHGIALRVEAPPSLPSIDVDTDRMTQVLNNLVSNSLRYTPPGGTIMLRASSEIRVLSAELVRSPAETQNHALERGSPLGQGSKLKRPDGARNSVVLQVSDTGQGIAPDDLPHIFDRFYRADKARQRDDSAASGLGLAITKAIVEAHGGTIAVESAPGSGTTFTITLPVARQPGTGDESTRGTHKRAAVGAREA